MVNSEWLFEKGKIVDALCRGGDFRSYRVIVRDQRSDTMLDESGVALCCGKTCSPKLSRTALGTVGDRIILTDIETLCASLANGIKHRVPRCL
ncbi:Uncharacterised protein [Mycobacterium xenopi]|uniref:Uncharacterized protein n=1 Tax=Mycobacterium xenopi TaxID=1789 RepID=A0AAD1GXJ9_MYCXE|nr:hypothetical protein MYXE_03240 [Mycobacterium xenopi]SPX79554.1 Uncharacterised protein [Mycobacterium xenopi]